MTALWSDDASLAPYRNVRDADLRGSHNLFLVESPRCVARFLRACRHGTWQPVSVLLAPEHVASLVPLAEAVQCPIVQGSMEDIALHSGYRFHHGALALGVHQTGQPLAQLLAVHHADQGCIVVADGVVHVDNIGSLFRNVACLGASAVVLGPGCADPLGRKCIRISMGRVFGVPFACVPDSLTAVKQLQEAGWTCTAVEQSASATPLHAWRPALRNAIVVGAEGRGVGAEILNACDTCVEIESSLDPLAAEGEGPPSLNVSTALAIVLHELRRHGGNSLAS